ncbi:amine sulfotransferase-like [Alligator mississippiensis]|nr:amine sulfotransferase-like [Alligator mississippiensis]
MLRWKKGFCTCVSDYWDSRKASSREDYLRMEPSEKYLFKYKGIYFYPDYLHIPNQELCPRGLKNRRLKVIYVSRNPKDVLVSFFHFSKTVITLEEIPDFNIFMERFLAGKVHSSSWLDHVRGWYDHRDEFSIFFLTYEEMIKDLRGVVLRICDFLGKELSEDDLDAVVKKATFENMKKDPRANYETMPGDLLEKDKGHFLRKGIYFYTDYVTPESIDSLEEFEIRDSDVFLITYPKSGTVWTQNILSLIFHEGHRDETEDIHVIDRVPWLEYNLNKLDYANRPSPRLFTTHLPYYLVPRGLKNKRVKVIYVARNPKDVLVSYFHFSKTVITPDNPPDFSIFMERFLAGEVLSSSWLDHVRGWYDHRDDFNILFLTYEEMKKDLRGAVLRICNFLGKELSEDDLDPVVKKATFENMKKDPRANYETRPGVPLEEKKCFLRKGTVGDWKNTMTVAQNERFEEVLKEKMKDLPFNYIWDNEEAI